MLALSWLQRAVAKPSVGPSPDLHPQHTSLRSLFARETTSRTTHAACWLGLQAVALAPQFVWMGERMRDGSDDPLGLVALVTLAGLLVMHRRAFRLRADPAWLLVAGGGTALAALAWMHLPPLAASLVGALSVIASLAAWLGGDQLRAGSWLDTAGTTRPWVAMPSVLPLAGLVLLALPLIASMQFYLGYPLRVITAQLSAWALQAAGFEAFRSGASMTVAGQLVIVDAPCSGVQMAWFAYFVACVVAVMQGMSHQHFLRRVAFVGMWVLAGNAGRNTVLVALESRPAGLSSAAHEGIGLVALALTMVAVAAWMLRGARHGQAALGSETIRGAKVSWQSPSHAWPRWLAAVASVANPRTRCVSTLAWLTLTVGCLIGVNSLSGSTAAVSTRLRSTHAAGQAPAMEWPTEFDGRPLRPLALTAVEQRFASRFPGAIARFADGERTLVLRHVLRPTRLLHPASDCFRAVGYRVSDAHLQSDARGHLWRCFKADQETTGRASDALRVCERIEATHAGASSATFTDASAWFWAASLGQSKGPWLAVTTVEAW